jgi:hypothetical protein
MFGKKDLLTKREYFWTDTSTKISDIRIELRDEKRTVIHIGDTSETKDHLYPEANKLLIIRNPYNGDIQIDYLKDDKNLAQEIISGHIISRVSIQFP